MTAHVLQRSTAEAELIRQFEQDGALASSPRRAAAFARFSDRGLPTRRVETWHYTDLRAAMGAAAPPAPAPDKEAIECARQTLEGRERLGGGRLVLINGRFISELSDFPSAIAIAGEEPSVVDVDDPMAALNEAMSRDTLALSVPDGEQIAEPIEIVNFAIGEEALSLYSRVAISLGVGARASFVETFLGARSRGQRNATTVLALAEGVARQARRRGRGRRRTSYRKPVWSAGGASGTQRIRHCNRRSADTTSNFLQISRRWRENNAWRLGAASTGAGAPTQLCKSRIPPREGRAGSFIAPSLMMRRSGFFRARSSLRTLLKRQTAQ